MAWHSLLVSCHPLLHPWGASGSPASGRCSGRRSQSLRKVQGREPYRCSVTEHSCRRQRAQCEGRGRTGEQGPELLVYKPLLCFEPAGWTQPGQLTLPASVSPLWRPCHSLAVMSMILWIKPAASARSAEKSEALGTDCWNTLYTFSGHTAPKAVSTLTRC